MDFVAQTLYFRGGGVLRLRAGYKTVALKAPSPYNRTFVSLPLQSTLQMLGINITFHSLSYLAGVRPRDRFNQSHSFSLKIGNETIFCWGPLLAGGP